MTAPRWRRAVLLGGSGYCGAHLAAALVHQDLADEVLLVDLRPPPDGRYGAGFTAALANGRIRYHRGDVRQPLRLPPGPVDLIVNLAAVHREPGHAASEYFETNVAGAEQACALAEASDCQAMIFVSSISVYGDTDGEKTEDTTPAPTSPYGSSKTIAEQRHLEWAAADPKRRLAIVRPGVVFGPAEGGNVTRLVHGVLHRRFAFVGSRAVAKAGLYVGEFVAATLFALAEAEAGRGNRGTHVVLANLTADPPPSVGAYAETAIAVAGVRRWIPTLPLWVVLIPVVLAYGVARLLGRRPAWHPQRIWKLTRPTAVQAGFLRAAGYVPSFTLRTAFEEWRRVRPDEWR